MFHHEAAAMFPAVREWLESFNRMSLEEKRQATLALRRRGRPASSVFHVPNIDLEWAEKSLELRAERRRKADSADDESDSNA